MLRNKSTRSQVSHIRSVQSIVAHLQFPRSDFVWKEFVCFCVGDALSVTMRVDLQICKYPLLLTAVMFNFCADELAVDLAKCKRSKDSNGSFRCSVLESLTTTDIRTAQVLTLMLPRFCWSLKLSIKAFRNPLPYRVNILRS